MVQGPCFFFSKWTASPNVIFWTDWLWQIIASAKMPGNFFSNSFCKEAATVAVHNGVPDHLIQSMGCWSGNTYQLYIKTAAEALVALSKKVA